MGVVGKMNMNPREASQTLQNEENNSGNDLIEIGNGNHGDHSHKIPATNDTDLSLDTRYKSHGSKALSYRQKEAMRKKELEERRKALEASTSRVQAGPPCEVILCGACKIAIEEFGKAIVASIGNPEYRFAHQLVDDFCSSEDISSRYSKSVKKICSILISSGEYSRQIWESFDDVIEFNHETKLVHDASRLMGVAKSFCVQVGACQNVDIEELNTEVEILEAENWTDECRVCRSVASNIEGRLYFKGNKLNESELKSLLLSSCENLTLPHDLYPICLKFLSDEILSFDEMLWRWKTHGENMITRRKIDVPFPEKICLEIKMCSPNIKSDIKQNDNVRIASHVHTTPDSSVFS